MAKIYLSSTRRGQWIQTAAIVVPLVLIAWTGTWLWREGVTVEQAFLKVTSKVMSIHVEPAMVPISGGTFLQGDLHGLGGQNEQPMHEVTINPFAMGQFEVTFKEYERYTIAMGQPLPFDQGWGQGRRPVIHVTWQDAKNYTKWLSEATGKRYRLPTESEWEYAARSGEKKDIWAGTSDKRQLKDYAVYRENGTAPVGENAGRKPNAFGLYDMSGNVWEWVEDCWHYDYKGAPTDGSAWVETESRNCGERVVRGGSWFYFPGLLRASSRSGGRDGSQDGTVGFRLAQDID